MSPDSPLGRSAWALLHEALALYRDSRPATDQLQRSLRRWDEPLRMAVAGPWQSGKSTLVNALVGEQVAPIEAVDGEQVFTWYQDGAEPYAVAYPAEEELPVSRSGSGMYVDTGRWRPAAVNDVVVTWPSRTLRHATLVDTPAVPAGDGEDGPTTADRILREADAVLCLTRDGRGSDLRFLERARQGVVSRAAPINLLRVLSRADELGGGRVDALLAARQLARREQRDPRIAPLCIDVVAVSGLVGLAGRVLSEPEFASLASLATVPRAELDRHLLSTDRFAAREFPAPVDPRARRALLDRLGIFGIRLALTLIRTGSDSRGKLAAELVRRAGLAELREAVARCFVDRQEVLKARSSLVALESVLRTEPRPGAERLFAGLEQALATAHDVRELRLLASLRGSQPAFDGELAVAARRLIGGDGTGVAARLGTDHPAGAAELWRLSTEALAQWQEQAEDPLLRLDQRRAARVVVRSCEAIVSRLDAG
jgi:hypothetical protein